MLPCPQLLVTGCPGKRDTVISHRLSLVETVLRQVPLEKDSAGRFHRLPAAHSWGSVLPSWRAGTWTGTMTSTYTDLMEVRKAAV